jgi:hypothetical protein
MCHPGRCAMTECTFAAVASCVNILSSMLNKGKCIPKVDFYIFSSLNDLEF